MSYKVIFSTRANSQLEALDANIAQAASPEIAAAYIDSVADHCTSLATFPQRGTMRDDVRPGLRITNHRKRTVIAFTVDHDQRLVLILGVFHGGQDYESRLLGELDN